jgi:hypothetical protein
MIEAEVVRRLRIVAADGGRYKGRLIFWNGVAFRKECSEKTSGETVAWWQL